MADSRGISRATFRSLIDPLLEGLGLTAEQVVSCSFDVSGFKLVLFHFDEEGHRVPSRLVSVPNGADGTSYFSGFAKVTIEVPVSDADSEVAV